MRAARFHDAGAAPRIDDVAAPARGGDDVLVEVGAAAVAHLDVTIAAGTFGMRPPLPYVGGVEGAGVVVDPGPASDLTAGQQVVLRGGGLGMRRDGTWTEIVSVPRRALTALTIALPAEVAATFFVPATTAHAALHDVAEVRAEDEVIVVGAAGAVGAMAAQLARRAGATVRGVVLRADQFPRIPAGVEAVDGSDPQVCARLLAERPASVLVDTLGGPGLVERCRWVRPGGRAAVVGYVTGPTLTVDLPSWLLDDVALLPVNMIRRERRAREVAGELVELLASGELTIAVRTYGLAETPAALDDLRAGRVGGRAAVLPRG